VLALDFHVFVCFVLFLVRLGHNHAAIFALVVDAGALDLVHAELAGRNLLFTVFAQLGLLSFLHHF
jgi:hypothetical protein